MEFVSAILTTCSNCSIFTETSPFPQCPRSNSDSPGKIVIIIAHLGEMATANYR